MRELIPADAVIDATAIAAEADQHAWLRALVREQEAHDLSDLMDAYYESMTGAL